MQRRSFTDAACPIARSLDHVGDWWTMLILRDAFRGATRFDAFQRSLGIAPNMLTARLGSLVESGILDRRPYSEHPPRYDYVLTERGREFLPVLMAIVAWGNRQFPNGPESVSLVDGETGDPIDPVMVDRNTGRIVDHARLIAPPIAGDIEQPRAPRVRERQPA